ncbi:hypothetical protein JOF56_004826 [Kibdelosporangium banguiense]|uniref:DUF3159 domain-containing protein n=1 Tax=Kibdelosporangium banguiense TaxID=1365924 RepID=A0ABS4TJA6_9PSEU|nr:DUF3159 domain-containing protein [Kibdelosporangium banguiense]MBP2324441.1 hypothetical protein [Kibdelosporangium banguiense]
MQPAPRQDTDQEGETAEITGPDMRERVRGAMLEIAPIFCFTASFAITHEIAVALPLALTAGIAVSVYRLVRREPVWRALAALGVVGIGSLLALSSGEATEFFVPNLITHGVVAVVSLVLLIAGWPPMGLLMGLVTGDGTNWRRCPVRRRAFSKASLALLASPVLMSSVEIPLYLADQAIALGVVDTFGPLVFVLAVMLGWRIYRSAAATHRCQGDPCTVTSHQ